MKSMDNIIKNAVSSNVNYYSIISKWQDGSKLNEDEICKLTGDKLKKIINGAIYNVKPKITVITEKRKKHELEDDFINLEDALKVLTNPTSRKRYDSQFRNSSTSGGNPVIDEAINAGVNFYELIAEGVKNLQKISANEVQKEPTQKLKREIKLAIEFWKDDKRRLKGKTRLAWLEFGEPILVDENLRTEYNQALKDGPKKVDPMIAKRKQFDEYYLKTMEYFENENYDLAVKSVEKALEFIGKKDINDAAILTQIGSVYASNKNQRQAVDYYNEAILFDPNYIPSYEEKYVELHDIKIIEDAIKIAEKSGTDDDKAVIYGFYSHVLYFGKEINLSTLVGRKSAKEYALMALKIDPNEPNAREVINAINKAVEKRYEQDIKDLLQRKARCRSALGSGSKLVILLLGIIPSAMVVEIYGMLYSSNTVHALLPVVSYPELFFDIGLPLFFLVDFLFFFIVTNIYNVVFKTDINLKASLEQEITALEEKLQEIKNNG
ncbi:hypothetical protein FACS1894125_2410 [Actinomycetota bacterium]|nr:hypothetical protein FACS1894125_2410 [Actinomycetota bacterium]